MPESVIAEPLCTVEYCPAPSDPDWHLCIICGGQPIDHHHVEPRGMGGSEIRKYNLGGIVALCRKHHEKVTTGDWCDMILEPPGLPRSYIILDVQGNEVFRQPDVYSQFAELSQAESVPSALSVAKGPSPAHDVSWRASELVSFPDWQLVQQFNEFYGAAGVLKMEAYRRVDAYRLKYAGVAGEKWADKAEADFEMPAKTLRHYSRAWQAFEQALDQTDVPDELKDAFQKMGGGVWQVIGRMPEATWPQMSEIALSVAANTGVGRGMAARVAAKGQEEGLLAKSDVKLRCPSCSHVAPRGEFEKVSDE